MMTREEARIELQAMKDTFEEYEPGGSRCQMALKIAISALRPVSRETVERMRGEWMFKPFYKGTSRGAIECQECKGSFEGSVGFNFCPNCGAPMTDEAVQMVMERLEALHETT